MTPESKLTVKKKGKKMLPNLMPEGQRTIPIYRSRAEAEKRGYVVAGFVDEIQKLSAVSGYINYKGRTIPAEVKSLADRIRKKSPDYSDSQAYGTAWKVYKKHVNPSYKKVSE